MQKFEKLPVTFEAKTTFLILPTAFVGTIVVGATTPSVLNVETFKFGNVAPVTVTNFLNGQNGQVIWLLGDGQTTVANNANVKTNTGANKLLLSNIAYSFVLFNNVWIELAGGTGGGGGGVTDGDKGDITVSGGGTVWTIDNTVVTYAKIQNVAANSFLANLTGASATLTEVATSRIPLFSSAITGTPSSTTVLYGNGVWATVNVSNVINRLAYANLTATTAASRLLGRGSAAGAGDWQELTIGAGLSLTGTVLAATGVTDGDKGDITVSASGATWTIDNTVVTYAKIQNVAANSFLANLTGAPASLTEVATNRIPLFVGAITGAPSGTTFLRGDGTWSGTGNVVGPGSSTDEALVRFDGTTGKIIQNSTTTLSDTGVLTHAGIIRVTSTFSSQWTVGYDASNKVAITVGSAGNVVFHADGAIFDRNLSFQYRIAIANEGGSYSERDDSSLTLPASTTTFAPVFLTVGVDPSTPVDGMVWFKTAGMFYRADGVTIGPLAATRGATGTTTVNFTTGKTDATVVIAGQTGIISGSRVSAWIECTATASHSRDEHAVADFDVRAGNIVAATGFTIYCVSRELRQFGSYTIGWKWE